MSEPQSATDEGKGIEARQLDGWFVAPVEKRRLSLSWSTHRAASLRRRYARLSGGVWSPAELVAPPENRRGGAAEG